MYPLLTGEECGVGGVVPVVGGVVFLVGGVVSVVGGVVFMFSPLTTCSLRCTTHTYPGRLCHFGKES